MSNAETSIRTVPAKVYDLPLNERWKWARETARLSHDRIVELMGRSNRSHLIKIEKGDHVPRPDLREAYADATNVPRELFTDDQEAVLSGDTFRGDGASGSAPRTRRRAKGAPSTREPDELVA